jgi:hypothetical protein
LGHVCCSRYMISAASSVYAMFQKYIIMLFLVMESINSTCQRSCGPMQNDQQLPVQMQWAPSRVSTGAAKKIMGPCEMIGSCHCKCNGPLRGHRQHLPKHLWAQAIQSAAATANAMGPFKGIDSTCRKCCGPM